MRKIIFIILFLISFQGVGQTFPDKQYYLVDSLDLDAVTESDRLLIDSCLKVYHKAKDDTSKIYAINIIVEASEDNNVWPKYNEWVYKTIPQLIKNNSSKESIWGLKVVHAGAINNIGYWYDHQGNISLAIEYYEKSLSILEELGDKDGIGNVYNNIASIYERQGNIPLALEYYQRSLKIRTLIDNQKGMSQSFNNIGVLHSKQGDKELALKYYEQSLKIKEKLEDKKGIGYSFNNIGYFYFEEKNYSLALKYYFKSLEIRESINDKRGLSELYNNIGLVYNRQQKTELALESYNKCLQIDEEVGDKEGIAISCVNIGALELLKNNNLEAEKYLKRALLLSKEIGFPEIISKASFHLSNLFQQQKNYKKSLEFHKLFVSMRDSLNNEKTQKSAAKQQAKYEYEKQKVLDDTEYDKLIAIEKEAKAKQKVITYTTAGGLALVLIFLIFVFNRLQVTKKQKLVIEGQKEEVEEAHKEITDSINYAERIQRSFLATKDMLDTNLKDYFVFFKPKDVVSGDFYWAGHLQNGNFAVVNADSTGHGVPGAIMSILNISSIEKAIEQGESNPSEIFNQTRNTIIERLKKDGSKEGGKDGMDASIICFDFVNNKFTYTAANNPIWVIRNKEVTIIKPDKMPVGKHDNDSTSFSQGEFKFKKGDQIYTLTDGFQDQFGGPKGKKFMVKKMRTYLLSISHLPMQEQHAKLNEVFTNWKGEHEQVDDVCVIGVKV